MTYDAASCRRKKELAASLKKLMQKKSFSKITIKEIVDDCGVNRKTFYYHFEDIYALLKWTLEQEAIDIVKHFDLLMQPEDAVSFVIDYVEANRHILNCAYDTIGRDEMRRFFYTDFINITSAVVQQAENNLGIHTDENFKRFLCDFYTEALASMLINMFKGNFDYSKKDILENTIMIMQVSIPNTLMANSKKMAMQANGAAKKDQ